MKSKTWDSKLQQHARWRHKIQKQWDNSGCLLAGRTKGRMLEAILKITHQNMLLKERTLETRNICPSLTQSLIINQWEEFKLALFLCGCFLFSGFFFFFTFPSKGTIQNSVFKCNQKLFHLLATDTLFMDAFHFILAVLRLEESEILGISSKDWHT